ncbi:MAG: DUF3604 domain-containing protein [Anaerolineae bacterium]|nr:DUF3604 domain-containing protein [Anaerolineae bacterium]
MQELDLGQARIEPDAPIVAGSFVTIVYTYEAGHPIDDSGFVKVVFRNVGDFGTPQFVDPCAPNYCSVSTSGDCRIEPRWDRKGHTRPWWQALYLQVTGGYLDRAEFIIVVFGDRSQGSPGWQMQTFREDTFEFKTWVDPIATYEFKELPASPTLAIVAGAPERAVCLAPSQILARAPLAYALRLEDRWGNPIDPVQWFTHPGWADAGVQTVLAIDERSGLSARSNPIEVLEQAPGLQRYWADFHGQTEETCGTNTIEDYFAFARDAGLLDIVGHQGNDFEVSDAFWETINATTARFYAPGKLVTFPGYEWSGNTPLGGDRNVYFAAEGGQIVHSSADLLPGKRSAYATAPTAAALFGELRAQGGPEAFAFAHVGGRYADLSMHDPEIELAVEVHSAWGTFEWLVQDALRLGYRIGICANSDGHKCRPGASYPGSGEFGSLGGLTCVLARDLTRESVLEALKARHFYATTGHRPLVDVRLVTEDGREAIMGDILALNTGEKGLNVGQAHLHVRVVGSAPIESIEVRQGLGTVATRIPYADGSLGRRIKIVWCGAEVRGRARQVSWDGGLTIEGNRIVEVEPINFWNPLRPVSCTDAQGLTWRSITTGGLAGVILTLEEAQAGTLTIRTAQGAVTCSIEALGPAPMEWAFGGLAKQIAIQRLPDVNPWREYALSLALTQWHTGDNPIYLRIAQEDGHLAWTSPIYVTV